jgi:hypothetical protein
MNAISAVVVLELVQLPLKINRVPEEGAIKILASNRPDQPFNERVRHRGVGHRLDFLDLEHAQVGKPSVESEQRIVISADAFRRGWPATAWLNILWQTRANLPVRIECEQLSTHCHDETFPASSSEAICQVLANCGACGVWFSLRDECAIERRTPVR